MRHPSVRVEFGRAESIPFETGRFDHALAQLVLHFVSGPDQAAREISRVVRPGGRVSACVWDVATAWRCRAAFGTLRSSLTQTLPTRRGP